VTLDKINRALRRKARELEVTLKIIQTHDVAKAITFLKGTATRLTDSCLLLDRGLAVSTIFSIH
jgi:hypothetical protein